MLTRGVAVPDRGASALGASVGITSAKPNLPVSRCQRRGEGDNLLRGRERIGRSLCVMFLLPSVGLSSLRLAC
jgi:hypothetical protein